MTEVTHNLIEIDFDEFSVKLNGTVLDADGEEIDLDELEESIRLTEEVVEKAKVALAKLKKMADIANG